jgi:hypothetical protein
MPLSNTAGLRFSSTDAFAADPATPVTLTLIPYYASANCARSAMQVWMPYFRNIEPAL